MSRSLCFATGLVGNDPLDSVLRTTDFGRAWKATPTSGKDLPSAISCPTDTTCVIGAGSMPS